MLLILGTVRLPPENLPRARAAMERMIAASRAEDGCLDYAYAQDVLDPGLIRISERWRDRASLDAHFAAPAIAEWRSTWPELGISGRDLSVYETDGPNPV